MDEIMPEVKTNESVAHWCSVDTRTGSLTCVLDSDHCFDAEIYMDELNCQVSAEVREDQRSKLSRLLFYCQQLTYKLTLANGYFGICLQNLLTRKSYVIEFIAKGC